MGTVFIWGKEVRRSIRARDELYDAKYDTGLLVSPVFYPDVTDKAEQLNRSEKLHLSFNIPLYS